MSALPVIPITSTLILEDSSVVVMARVLATDRQFAVQADVSAIALKVADFTTAEETHDATLVVADTVFNTLQTDARWTVDSTGYNFRYTVPYTAFPTGDRTYRIEALFVLSDGARGKVPWQVRAERSRTAL
jgi:hypothetical protein